jgi:hypothetical protein
MPPDTRTPVLSVVVASRLGWPYIDACLASLARQDDGVESEVIVACQVGSEVVQYVSTRYAGVRLIECPGPKSVFELRAAGILAARGDIVALTSDYCIVPAGWYASIVCAHTTHPDPAIGGAVDNGAVGRVVDWAAYFCEYSRFSNPVPEGGVHDLPGSNVSYKRSALDEWRPEIEPGYRETFLHRRMKAAGCRLWSSPTIVVLYNRRYRFREFLASRFHYGRWFAGTRRMELGRLRQLSYPALTLLLPPWLVARIARPVLARRRHLGKFAMALPLVACFVAVGTVGELVGGLFGPGDSALRLH